MFFFYLCAAVVHPNTGPGLVTRKKRIEYISMENIYRVDEAFTTASAFAVKDGQFIYVGDGAGVQAHIGPLTFTFDLEGKNRHPRFYMMPTHTSGMAREFYIHGRRTSGLPLVNGLL